MTQWTYRVAGDLLQELSTGRAEDLHDQIQLMDVQQAKATYGQTFHRQAILPIPLSVSVRVTHLCFCFVHRPVLGQIAVVCLSNNSKQLVCLSHPVFYHCHNVPPYSYQSQHSPLNLTAGQISLFLFLILTKLILFNAFTTLKCLYLLTTLLE